MEKIKTDVLKQMFLDGARLIIEKEPYLTEIDSVIGDGDHGEGMKRGCEALIKILETENFINYIRNPFNLIPFPGTSCIVENPAKI